MLKPQHNGPKSRYRSLAEFILTGDWVWEWPTKIEELKLGVEERTGVRDVGRL